MKSIFILLAVVATTSCTKEISVENVAAEPIKVESKRILVDASHDGGVWWFPQSGRYDPDSNHQGKRLADYLRGKGFIVDELPRDTRIDSTILLKYDKVIRATQYTKYTKEELKAYKSFLAKPSSLMLVAEFIRPGQTDELAGMLGLILGGAASGYILKFAEHSITENVNPFFFWAGSVVLNPENKAIVPLGWLDHREFADLNGNNIFDTGEPKGPVVMGIVQHPTSKVFFIGDLNGIEHIPQPFTDNLVAWLFQ
jgi:hypothetical protein